MILRDKNIEIYRLYWTESKFPKKKVAKTSKKNWAMLQKSSGHIFSCLAVSSLGSLGEKEHGNKKD